MRELVESIANVLNVPVSITEADGSALWGVANEGERSAIQVSSGVVGWVISPAQPQMIAGLLQIVAADDMEKRELAREGVQKYRELALLYDVSEKISSCLRVVDIVRLVYAEVKNVIDKGEPLLLLLGQDGADLIDPMESGPTSASIIQSCHAFVGGLIRENKPEIVNNPRDDPRFDGECSALGALMAVPLIAKENRIGALLVTSGADCEFRSEEMRLLAGLGTLCAAAIEKARLYENIEKESRLRANFQRYLSPTIVDDIIANRTELALGGKSIECSILFSDICGFTSMSERQPPETVVRMLNEYFSAMSEIVFRYGGTLDKFIGDAIMAVFGAPFPYDDAHHAAIRASIEMHQTLRKLQWKWERLGSPLVRHRIGISTGRVISGNIGSEKRMDYTVIGDPVNVASRMEALSPAMGTYISEETYQKVRDDVIALPMMPVRIKGKETPMSIYSVLGMRRQGESDRWIAALPVEILEESSSTQPHRGVLVGMSDRDLLVHTASPLSGDPSVIRQSLSELNERHVPLDVRVVEQQEITDESGCTYFCNRLTLKSRIQDGTDVTSAGFLLGISEISGPRMEVYGAQSPHR